MSRVYYVFDIGPERVADIFMIDIFGSSNSRGLREGRGIHLTRVLPALNYESTRCARLKVEGPIKGRKRPS